MNKESLTLLIEDIARKHTRVTTLETRNSDRLDFHDISVWSLSAALRAAFAAGQQHPTGLPAADTEAAPLAMEAEQHLTSYLEGFGRGQPANLAAVAERTDWPELAAREVERRAGRLLEHLDGPDIEAIANGSVNPAIIARRLMSLATAPGLDS